MVEFLRRNRVLVAVSFFMLLSAGMVLRSSGPVPQDDAISRLFLELTLPAQRLGNVIVRNAGGAFTAAAELWVARDEARLLRARLQELERQLVMTAELEMENDRLRRLLDFRAPLTEDVLTARVVGRDATGLSRTVTIDRGENDGVARSAAVLVAEGIVGHVFATSPHAARVLLISDHNSGVDAIVQRTRARGIVEGTFEGGCGLKFLKRTEDVAVGDLVVTSGLDGLFPKALPIGRVTIVDKKGQGLFQYAEVTPSIDVEHLEEVLVVRRTGD